MKKMFVLLVCVFGLATAHVAVAQTPDPVTTDLRGAADEAANSANGEANAPAAGEVAEAVTEAVTGEGAPTLDADSGAEDAIAMVSAMVEAFKGGNIGLGIGLLLMLLVWLLRSLKIPFVNTTILAKVPPKATPWVAATLGIVGSIGVELMAGQLHWGMAIVNGIFIGATTVGLWEMIGKKFLPNGKATEEAAA
jgi:hypothetical protein